MTNLLDRLDRTPGSSQLHRWADWAELICFASDDGRITVPELSSRIRERRDQLPDEAHDDQEPTDTTTDPLIFALEVSEEELRELESADDLEEDLGTDSQDSLAREKFEAAVKNRADDILKYLAARQARYKEAYPFLVDLGSRTVELRDQTESRDVYLFLLICSSFLYLSEKRSEGEFAFAFEVLSTAALKNYLPTDSEVHLFGTNPYHGSGRYEGLLFDKVKLLAGDLNLRLLADRKDFHPNDRGDHGLDIAAWLPLGDKLAATPVLLAQCACTREWVTKQHSSTANQWRPLISFAVDPVSVCLIPFDFRDLDGGWYYKTDIHGTVLLDRQRLIHLLLDVGSDYANPRVVGQLDDLGLRGLVSGGRAADLVTQ